ncbi:fumarylacetoacetate hydrolase family protein [Brevibacterium sp. BRM-1]|uniref:fumarylacetoacetate hydrolase family protein n=1 Tax=Brevibacterium sp. BRM-1 TaxID=2999062 RepID=UPI00227F6BF8|nr:fumarylacetoacetate hydrolase family protein [Brevibacterium sp. BRM-1]WAL39763.1 fumarylacetoacetate hydrolase family protein [Brevibacterium sp. BRM-1]
MKLIGLADAQGAITVADRVTDSEALVLGGLAEFWEDPAGHIERAGRAEGERVRVADFAVVPPVLPDARVICIGLNYRKHHAEGSYSGEAFPEYPTLFARWTRSLTVAGTPVPVPSNEAGLDWEGEVAAFVGTDLVDADPDEALAAVVGYAAFNDITSRRAQKLSSQWILGKNGDLSGPLGPLVPADEVGDLRDGLRVVTRVNGEIVQDGNTRDLVYDVGSTLSLISHTLTLRAGDVLATGTPEGVGYSRTPPWLLQPGDEVSVEAERLGVLANPITDSAARTRG